MYVYMKVNEDKWTVGFFDPDGEWMPESDHDDALDAAQWVSFLNGGNMPLERPLLTEGDNPFQGEIP